MGSRQLVIRAGRRCALAVAAIGIVAAAGALDVGSTSSPSPERSSAATSAQPTAPDTRQSSSAYSLQTQGGPRSVRVARVVTGTMLLTGLVLTALGAIGMRGPELIRHRVVRRVVHQAGSSRYRWQPPGVPRTGLPTNPGTGPPGA
ncbi:hypothetical protein ACIBSV_25565 [Embleya sp. NPDC050154]|uniref:hypothetical protein n=1 Tax=unclassified Embleya TaxID=2699296 RepID=UPI0037B3B022